MLGVMVMVVETEKELEVVLDVVADLESGALDVENEIGVLSGHRANKYP